MKDNFSNVSKSYSQFRPGYPEDLFKTIISTITSPETAWDCGTGTGQVALPLSRYFQTVYGTDISVAQLQNASLKDNIIYSKQPAENTNFQSEMFDLITVGQAIHWFNFTKFYSEVNRTLKPDGTIAVMGYGLLTANEETRELINEFYHDIVGPFWDPERKFIDENYTTIPFPFREIPVPQFKITFEWSLKHLVGYLRTWSAVQHFIKKMAYDPVDKIIPALEKSFGSGGEVTFPILLRVGKKH